MFYDVILYLVYIFQFTNLILKLKIFFKFVIYSRTAELKVFAAQQCKTCLITFQSFNVGMPVNLTTCRLFEFMIFFSCITFVQIKGPSLDQVDWLYFKTNLLKITFDLAIGVFLLIQSYVNNILSLTYQHYGPLLFAEMFKAVPFHTKFYH